jgi:hypothetical protein
MLDTITKPESKRELIERELMSDPNRSDREISKIVGCDHKTVGAARKSGNFLGEISPPLGNLLDDEPTPNQLRNLLVNGANDYLQKYPPENAEQLVDRVLAETKVAPPLAQARPPRPEVEFEDFDWYDDPSIILKCQPATAIYHNPKGCIVIRQERSWAEESDPFVYITPENAVTFMEALAKRARE